MSLSKYARNSTTPIGRRSTKNRSTLSVIDMSTNVEHENHEADNE